MPGALPANHDPQNCKKTPIYPPIHLEHRTCVLLVVLFLVSSTREKKKTKNKRNVFCTIAGLVYQLGVFFFLCPLSFITTFVQMMVCWPYFDPEFDNLPDRIFGPPCRVCIDNDSMEDCTVIKVDSVNKQGILLEVVQVLTNINLTILKSYISSDAGWFMDVFHVKDEHGSKISDQNVINYIHQAIGTVREIENRVVACRRDVFDNSGQLSEHTAIEMRGTDRPGLFSEISAALVDLHCNIVEAHAWSHNARLACVAYISDQSTDTPIDDPHRLTVIEDHLTTVLRATTTTTPTGSSEAFSLKEVKTSELGEGTNMTDVERRLHQLMLSVGDFHRPQFEPMAPSLPPRPDGDEDGRKTIVSIENCDEKWYSIVSIRCKDRPRLMFDTVCTITDMQYVIFHASISSHHGRAFQEYFIRHVDGYALITETEQDNVIKCLEAAIERRVCEGIRLELSAENRVGLLSDITRVLRENGLCVVRADVKTQGEKAVNAFYLKDILGNEVDKDFVESVKKDMDDVIDFEVKGGGTSGGDSRCQSSSPLQKSPGLFSLGDALKSQIQRISHNFIPIN